MKDEFTKQWITENSERIVSRYAAGALTIRGLHYQLVGLGMTNSMRHYKRVVTAMIAARREGLIHYGTFSDHDRGMESQTDWEETIYENAIESGKDSIKFWMEYYRTNRWENQEYYPELWIEKKALIGTFKRPCDNWDVALSACKGYPSLTFLYEASQRFDEAEGKGKKPIILYFGDYDPSGEDIPRSIKENLWKDFGVDVEVKRIALMEDQVVKWNLPPAPAKSGDSRTASWDGLGQVELDAVSPERLSVLINNSIQDIFDDDAYNELQEREDQEREQYQAELKKYVNELAGE